jgi:hypothetical protein
VLAVEAASDRDWNLIRMHQQLIYSGAMLNRTGYHQPNKMPRFEKVFPDPRRKRIEQTPQENMAAMMAWTRHLQSVIRTPTPERPVQ